MGTWASEGCSIGWSLSSDYDIIPRAVVPELDQHRRHAKHLWCASCRCHRSVDFKVCCVAGFQTRGPCDIPSPADLEIGDTAGLETCATSGRVRQMGGSAPRCAQNLFTGRTGLDLVVSREERPQFWHFERKDLREVLPGVTQHRLPISLAGWNGFAKRHNATVR